MVDDIRPRGPKPGDENKNLQTPPPPSEPIFVEPELMEQEDGFVITKVSDEDKKGRTGFSMKNLRKRQKVLLGVVVGVVLIIGGGSAYALTRKSTPAATPTVVQKKEAPPKPTTEASRLTGVQIPIDVNKRPITSIQIENSPDARPQSGLKDAGVVFEAIAEGGITRFNASFLESQPDYIGPIRSVRPYYARLAAPFDPIFVHAGGSGDGLATLRALGLKDLDHGANGGAFQRVSNRYAPHNLYSSMAKLDEASRGRGYNTSDVKSFLRKDEKKGLPVTAKAIDFNISSPLYNVHYDYDAASNTYLRSMGGRPHTDERSGAQLAPKTVVALVMNWSQSGIYSVYQTTGEGTAFIFQDGQVQQVTWKKAGDKEQLQFIGADGKPVALDAGQTWFTLLKDPGAAKYSP